MRHYKETSENAMNCNKNKIPFIDTLLKNKEISNFFNEQDLLKIIDPSNYLGAAPTMAQRLLDNRKLP